MPRACAAARAGAPAGTARRPSGSVARAFGAAPSSLTLSFFTTVGGDLVLDREDVVELAVVGLRPDVRADRASISCAVMRTVSPALRTEPSSTCATSSVRRDLAESSTSLPLNENDDVRAVTWSCGTLRQQVQQLLGDAVGEIFLVLVRRHVRRTAAPRSTVPRSASVAASSLTPWRSTKRSVSSSTTATASTPMIAKSSLRPVWCVIDSAGSISLSRLSPCGVNS